MTLHPVPLGGPSLAGIKLKPHAIATPALSSHLRPALVLAERESRRLMEASRQQDVTAGGRFSTSPAFVQVWDKPWDSADDPGSALYLGSVDWNVDTPVRHYVTIYRAMVTASGVAQGHTTLSILQTVMALSGVDVDGSRISDPAPPIRDPFRRPA